MADGSFDTTRLQTWVDRLRAGDRAAADELLRAVGGRLERLARRMLLGFPNVKRWADTDDVLQGAVLRLLRTLERLRPKHVRDFFKLSAVQIRRELLDLARHFYGPEGLGANHASPPPGAVDDPVKVVPDLRDSSGELEKWQRFHEAVERLPDEEREAMALVFYHGSTQAQVAKLLEVSERTVRRYWQSACLRLNEEMGGSLPGLGDGG
jgi:RNA polymerase sigma-70 factor (ECF subfamily)